MQKCTNCASQNSDDAKFCSQCGTPLTSLGSSGDTTATITFGIPVLTDGEERQALNDADAAAIDALPAGHALLVVARGPGAGSRYLLDTDLISVGRHPDSDIFLDDITVSRRHVEFRRNGSVFSVRDLGSLNGTYVNSDRIDEADLQNGDEVRIGKFRLLYFDSSAKGS
ncbi:MAG TPA: FHA domain-containing protein [Marmoricola sp.]|nr:FHA domain-containing protein [Marmoricola sp.]HNI70329.1 FHA domain-containing protein [Marmoricola sp.]HNJ77841.1 FHA domain-containing protein [Marmoricola sp.]HNN48038.1 FHA domain-containing protein [Marmoricola sp.]HNO39394.1 FHA domain-containing protein [Marmoricola sp.]